MRAVNVKISENSISSIELYKKKYESLLEKLSLQQKYSEQEIQTLKLNYDTKLIDLNLKLEELSSIKETIGLYKSKNEELSHKLTEKENELLETRMNKISTIQPQTFTSETVFVSQKSENTETLTETKINPSLNFRISNLEL